MNINYDSGKFNRIDSIVEEASVMLVMTRSGISTFEDLKGKAITAASTGAGEFYPSLLVQELGAKIKIISCYKGLGPEMLAMQCG